MDFFLTLTSNIFKIKAETNNISFESHDMHTFLAIEKLKTCWTSITNFDPFSSSQFRRHKSASPSRRKSVPPPNQCGCHHNTNHQHHHHHHGDGHMTLHRHHHHVQHMSATLRSKSTGKEIEDKVN